MNMHGSYTIHFFDECSQLHIFTNSISLHYFKGKKMMVKMFIKKNRRENFRSKYILNWSDKTYYCKYVWETKSLT